MAAVEGRGSYILRERHVFIIDHLNAPGKLGATPTAKDLAEVVTFGGSSESTEVTPQDIPKSSSIAQHAASFMALLTASGQVPQFKGPRVWLGEGLGSIPKKLHDHMLWGEFIDMADLCQRSPGEKVAMEGDAEKLVVTPGFEVSWAKQKPVTSIITWLECFSRYVAVMAKHLPECTPGMMSHKLIVLRAYKEVEDPAWHRYDEAYREKMAATGTKMWVGMDVVTLHQQFCGGQPRKRTPGPQCTKSDGLGKEA